MVRWGDIDNEGEVKGRVDEGKKGAGETTWEVGVTKGTGMGVLYLEGLSFSSRVARRCYWPL